MALRLVIDPTTRPAGFGRAAALEARRCGARFLHAPAVFDLSARPDAAQYVHAAGGLGPSGLFLAERVLGHPVEPAIDETSILAVAARESVVVPIHPAFGQGAASLRAAAHRAGIRIEEVVAAERPHEVEVPAKPGSLGSAPTVVVVGREEDHREVYPAALVSLLNAAEARGRPVRIAFAAPRNFDTEALVGANGVLLPGGSDMGGVPAQIAAAHHALAQRVPVLGLCLGMQTMTTAFAQVALADPRIGLAEADPAAPAKSFVPMAGDVHLPRHRTGEATIDVTPGTRLAQLSRAPAIRIRCNHRYHLAPDLRDRLERVGLTMSATSFRGRVVDAVECGSHPFFIGFQGHPELGTSSGFPHPSFQAFLTAAEKHLRDARSESHTSAPSNSSFVIPGPYSGTRNDGRS